jgi:hypothetical protein
MWDLFFIYFLAGPGAAAAQTQQLLFSVLVSETTL